MQSMWEILVPTQIDREDGPWYVSTKYHRVWDAKVRTIAGGLTILRPAIGNWISENNELFVERMIPVRIACSAEEIRNIAEFTKQYYKQLRIMYYKVSDEVYFI